ncbi:MAG: hypothetical protein AB8B56_18750 [Crocinitomicaceae bacterium]
MRIALASILGLAASWAVNMGILQIFLFGKIEEGVDQNEAMMEMFDSFTAIDYLTPLAAHVFGILIGLIVARLICKTSNIPIYIIGGLHMAATVANIFMIPAPTWFIIVDLVLPILIILYFLRTKKKK